MSEEPARSEEAEQVVPPAREPECAEFTRLEILGLGLLIAAFVVLALITGVALSHLIQTA